MSDKPLGPCQFSAVIPTRNRPEELMRCLKSIVEQTRRPAQVVVVDDGQLQEGPFRGLLESAGIEWTCLKKDRLDRNRSRNLGVEASKHPIVAFLDDDMVLDARYFEELVGILEQFARVGVVGTTARIRKPRPAGRLRWGRRAAERLFLIRGRRLGGMMRSGFCTDIEEEDEVGIEPFDVDFSSAGACAYFREICRRHPFPEGYSFLAAGDDKMFGLRITRHWRTLFVPRATAVHLWVPASRPSHALQARRRVLGYYWTYRQFARRTPFDFLLFVWGCFGLTSISLAAAAARRRPRHLQYAAGLLRGLGKAFAFQLRAASLRQAVEEAAARFGEPIEKPVGLGKPLLVDPQEIPADALSFLTGAAREGR